MTVSLHWNGREDPQSKLDLLEQELPRGEASSVRSESLRFEAEMLGRTHDCEPPPTPTWPHTPTHRRVHARMHAA